MSITIGLSRGSGSPKHVNYYTWLQSSDPDVTVVDLYTVEDPMQELNRLDALILTGGGDIDPIRYGIEPYRDRCTGIDERRDEMELAMISQALDQKMPLLGICRGLQIINVSLGGTLIPNIPDVEGYFV